MARPFLALGVSFFRLSTFVAAAAFRRNVGALYRNGGGLGGFGRVHRGSFPAADGPHTHMCARRARRRQASGEFVMVPATVHNPMLRRIVSCDRHAVIDPVRNNPSVKRGGIWISCEYVFQCSLCSDHRSELAGSSQEVVARNEQVRRRDLMSLPCQNSFDSESPDVVCEARVRFGKFLRCARERSRIRMTGFRELDSHVVIGMVLGNSEPFPRLAAPSG